LRRKGFLLVDIIVGLGILGLIGLVLLNAVVLSSKAMGKSEKRGELIDVCQRIVEELKVPSDDNNILFSEISIEGGYHPISPIYLVNETKALVKLDSLNNKTLTFTVLVREGDESIELTSSRIRE
jgi:hypothetical protein